MLVKLFNLFPSAVGDKLFLIDSLWNKVINYRKKHQFIERIVGEYIKCELAGVGRQSLLPLRGFKVERRKARTGVPL